MTYADLKAALLVGAGLLALFAYTNVTITECDDQNQTCVIIGQSAIEREILFNDTKINQIIEMQERTFAVDKPSPNTA